MEAQNSYIPELVYGRPVSLFGPFLKQVCLRVGLTQPYLEKKGQAKFEELLAEGRVSIDVQGSLLQQSISQVITGQQPVSYWQLLIWSMVIEEHYNSALVKNYFEKKGYELPLFTPEIKEALWRLAGYQPPEAIEQAILDFSGFDYVPRRLPHKFDMTTDGDIPAVQPTTDAIPIREI